jgi:hypothetical protein
MRLQFTIGIGDAHAQNGCLLSRYDREPPRRFSQAALLLLPLAFLPREPARRALSDYDHKAPSSSPSFQYLREHKAARGVLAHGEEEKKRILEEERAQNSTLLGSYLRDEPWKNDGKNRQLLRIVINDSYQES